MDRYAVRFTIEVGDGHLRLDDIPVQRDVAAAERALEAIQRAIELPRFSPFSCRKALSHNSFLRELVIAFGSAGHVALFEIESRKTVTILAQRHQREEDYH